MLKSKENYMSNLRWDRLYITVMSFCTLELYFMSVTSSYFCIQVQKKLQMRIEAQGKYLKAILEKAHRNISFDENASGNIESTRSQLTDFNLALSGFVENATQVYEENNEQLVKATSDDNHKDNHLNFQLYNVASQEAKDVKCTQKTEDSLLLDLNIKGGYDLSSRGMQACELDLKINQQIM